MFWGDTGINFVGAVIFEPTSVCEVMKYVYFGVNSLCVDGVICVCFIVTRLYVWE